MLVFRGTDSLYLHLAVDDASLDSLRIFSASLQADLVSLPRGCVVDFGMWGYRWTLVYNTGVRIMVPGLDALHLGLYVMLSPAFLNSVPADEWEPFILGLLERFAVSGTLTVRRFDYAFDFAWAAAPADLSPDACVSRGRHRAWFYDQEDVCGCQIGKGDVVCRVYNKVLEASQDQDLERWRSWWAAFGGRGDYPSVWRVEFQFRKDALLEFGVSDVASLLDLLGGILGYMVRWVRFEVEGVVCGFWRELVSVVASLVGGVGGLGGVCRRALPRSFDSGALVDQALGCLARVAALDALKLGRGSPLTVDEVTRVVLGAWKARHNVTAWDHFVRLSVAQWT